MLRVQVATTILFNVSLPVVLEYYPRQTHKPTFSLVPFSQPQQTISPDLPTLYLQQSIASVSTNSPWRLLRNLPREMYV